MVCRLCPAEAEPGRPTCAKCGLAFAKMASRQKSSPRSIERGQSCPNYRAHLAVVETNGSGGMRMKREQTRQLIVARRRHFPADLPVDVRATLGDVAYVAREAADTNDPEVARLSLEVLARQAQTLAAIADGVR